MFSLFPIHRPRLGISFRAHTLDLVEVRHRWSRVLAVTRVSTRPLPAGLLVPSETMLNVSDPPALTQELRALLDGGRDRTVAIGLPMACGTLALHHFETFPSLRTEQEALLRWRLRQEEHLTGPDLALRWHTFPSTDPDLTTVSVLSVAIRQSVLDQYHRVCEEADLLPVSMGWSTIHLLELARSAMTAQDELYVAHRTAEALVVLAFRQGRPVGLRVKPRRRTHADVKTALLQTLWYFSQEDPHRDHGVTHTTPLYLIEEGVAIEHSPSPKDPSEVWTMSEQPCWTVPVVRAHWATAPIVST